MVVVHRSSDTRLNELMYLLEQRDINHAHLFYSRSIEQFVVMV